jgi:hypothetical protein
VRGTRDREWKSGEDNEKNETLPWRIWSIKEICGPREIVLEEKKESTFFEGCVRQTNL